MQSGVCERSLIHLPRRSILGVSVVRTHPDTATSSRVGVLQMRAAALEQTLPDKGLAQEQLDVFFCPLPCRQ
jgi:hypothetical protein